MARVIIQQIKAREIINGRGIPAVEVEVITNNGLRGIASSPSGVSTSEHEAVEIRDGGTRYLGKGVMKAVRNIQQHITPYLVGMDVTNQYEVDQKMVELDGTPNKSKLGGNAITAVSLAVAKAGALSLGLPLYKYLGGIKAYTLPILCPNMLSGSKTAGNDLDFEDYLIVPFGFSRSREAIRASVEVFHILHQMLRDRFGLIPQITALAPPLKSTEEALNMIQKAIKNAGYKGKIGFGIDVASGLLYDKKKKKYKLKRGEFTTKDLIAYYVELVREYPIIFLEDGLHENDFEGFSELTEKLNCIVIGDDLFATNEKRLIKGAAVHAANAILFKVNQAGTLTEALRTVEVAQRFNYTIVSSVRSGETDDSAQADLSVAVGAKLMKVGAPIRGEMVTKYNRLLKIEEELGEYAYFQGRDVQKNRLVLTSKSLFHRF
jgi:enolase